MLSLKICQQGPRRQPHTTIRTIYPPSQSLSVGRTNPHSIKRGGGRIDPEMGDSGGANRGGNGGTRGDHTGVGGVIISI